MYTFEFAVWIQFEFDWCQPPATASCYVSVFKIKQLNALSNFPLQDMENSFQIPSSLLPPSLPPLHVSLQWMFSTFHSILVPVI